MTALTLVLTVAVIALSVLVFGLLRAYATVLQRLHDLESGTAPATKAPPFRTVAGVPAPPAGDPEWAAAHDVSGVGRSGEVVSVRTLGVEHDTVLLFLSSGCAGCTGFWEDLAQRRDATLFAGARVLVLTKGPEAESPALLAELAPPWVDLIMSTQAWTDYEVPGSPYVAVVDGHTGRVKGQGSGASLTQVSGLIQQAFGDLTGRPGGPGLDFRPVHKPRADRDRETDVDRTLLAAGIGPGHPSLYPTAETAPAAGHPAGAAE